MESEREVRIINTHIHIFEFKIVPAGFLLGLPPWLYNEKKLRLTIFIKVLGWLNKHIFRRSNDLLDRIERYLKVSSQTTESIFHNVNCKYPPNTEFVVLPMDMAYMGAGKVNQRYEDQLIIYEGLRKKNKRIKPFVKIDPGRWDVKDPRRNNENDNSCNFWGRNFGCIKDFVEFCIENRNFSGIKLYPPMGYFPWDNRLDKMYCWAEKKEIPIIVHTNKCPIFFRGSMDYLKKYIDEQLKNIRELAQNSESTQFFDLKLKVLNQILCELFEVPKSSNICSPNPKVFKSRLRFIPGLKPLWNYKACALLTHPLNYKILLAKFPKLKISLAHFGGGDEVNKFTRFKTKKSIRKKLITKTEEKGNWFYIIYNMLKEKIIDGNGNSVDKYPGLSADISATWGKKKYLKLLKIMLNLGFVNKKILFGSDYYMNQATGPEELYADDLRKYLKTQKKFLFKKEVDHNEILFTQIAMDNPKKFLSTLFSKVSP